KGIIWQIFGLIFLHIWIWIYTGDFILSSILVIIWTGFRAIMWPIYEAIFKLVIRKLRKRKVGAK
ncbi:MAG: hypothetical protein QQN41_08030, partial [Nitrosopumilus sp.]